MKRLTSLLNKLAKWAIPQRRRSGQIFLLSILLCLCSFFTVLTVHTVAQETDAIHPSISVARGLMTQGQQLYQTGQFKEAARVWEEAAQSYEKQGNRVDRALALSYLALAYQQLGDWSVSDEAIAHSTQLLGYDSENKHSTLPNREAAILARVLNTQGTLQFNRGQTEAALFTWQVAAEIYQEVADLMGEISTQLNQAKALQVLGLYRRSEQTLEHIKDRLQEQPNSPLKAEALLNLGNVLRLVGSLDNSQQVLVESLAVAEAVRSPADLQAALLNLGNTARARGDRDAALEFYQKAAGASVCLESATGSCLTQRQAQLNQLTVLVETEQWSPALALSAELYAASIALPPSQMAVYAQINLAKNLMDLAQASAQEGFELNPPTMDSVDLLRGGKGGLKDRLQTVAAELLATAVQGAKRLENLRSESYALGTLGHLYEQTTQFPEAQQLTNQALALAQAINAPDIAYQWSWQLGRLQTKQQPADIPGAIASYTEAFNTLNSVKRDLVAMNPDVQFDFQESVEPVYRELVGLLLAPAKSERVSEVIKDQKNISQALQVIESFYVTELDNYFREACLSAKPQQIDQIDPHAAVIYPIILPDRLETIVSLPGRPLSHSSIFETAETVETTARQMRNSLRKTSFLQERLPLAQKLYDWLIRPVAADLASDRIDTLVFVLDGAFRNVPMAALHDGDRYLVEQYAIAVSSGVQLLESRSFKSEQLQALTGGVSEASQGFNPLPGVELELTKIAAQVPAETLLNENFTRQRLKEQITKTGFPVIHLATHGQFSSNPEETFILTWDDKIKVKDLQTILSDRQLQPSPIELLVLSACQTAEGDKRATLGLAGIALRSGARSTLATLWSVNDQSTAVFMAEFYRELTQPNLTKAKAQRLAQIKLLKDPKYKHPFYWAPFVLVGNWQ